MSTVAPLRSARNPLFRLGTPLGEEDSAVEGGQDDLERFRLRNQSVFSLADPQADEEEAVD